MRQTEIELENAVLIVDWSVRDTSFDHEHGREVQSSAEIEHWTLTAFIDHMEVDITEALSDKLKEFYRDKAQRKIDNILASEEWSS